MESYYTFLLFDFKFILILLSCFSNLSCNSILNVLKSKQYMHRCKPLMQLGFTHSINISEISVTVSPFWLESSVASISTDVLSQDMLWRNPITLLSTASVTFIKYLWCVHAGKKKVRAKLQVKNSMGWICIFSYELMQPSSQGENNSSVSISFTAHINQFASALGIRSGENSYLWSGQNPLHTCIRTLFCSVFRDSLDEFPSSLTLTCNPRWQRCLFSVLSPRLQGADWKLWVQDETRLECQVTFWSLGGYNVWMAKKIHNRGQYSRNWGYDDYILAYFVPSRQYIF